MSTTRFGIVFLALTSIRFPVQILAQVPVTAYVNFEGAQTNPIRISPDGTRLFALNTPDNRVSVFDLSQPSNPSLIVEIPVGIEPVSVNPRTSDEAWVVNQESDSVSIVSVSKGIVTDTIYCKDEPSDVVFAGSNLAFVSVARSNLINVYDTGTHNLVKSIPVFGENPRALVASSDGSKVYAAFALSGNHSTIIPDNLAPPPCGLPGQTTFVPSQCVPAFNPALPAPPQVSLIVDASDPNWTSVITYTMPDNDVVEIDTGTLSIVQYFSHVGTINLGIALQPNTGQIFVANTDALNSQVIFEPNLKGHMVNHRVTLINPSTSTNTFFDLNPGINYGILPNPAAIATALAQPTALAFDPTGQYLYLAAFGTDRVGIFDTVAQQVKGFVEINPSATGSTVNPATKRGPRGLAVNASAQLLYVLNRIYNTISIVSTSQNSVVAEIPTGTFDPTPTVIRNGRGFLYDHKLSGNGTAACASCHIDAEMDLLAWNLGNPAGSMAPVVQNGQSFQMHPMKGPMTTQSLRGLVDMAPYHWRGDRANFAAFNPAFNSLLGGSELSTADMTAYTNFINTVVYMPNPNQNLDRTLPASLTLPDTGGTGLPPAGENTIVNVSFGDNVTCAGTCHTSVPGPGTDLLIHEKSVTNTVQPLKVPHLRNQYQKIHFNYNAGAQSIDGFGFEHDGHQASLFNLVATPGFGTFRNNATIKSNLEAFMLCFDTGMAPAVGYTRTLTSVNVNTSPAQSDWLLLQSQAALGNIDLIAKGTISGQLHGLLYQPATNNYETDTTGLGPYTQAQLVTFIQNSDTLSIMGVPAGSGVRMGIDRNLNGIKDGDEPPAASKKRSKH